VKSGKPEIPDIQEPEKIASAVKELGLKYVVITSVTRDDLDDKGAGHFVDVVKEIKSRNPETAVELLIPDMGGDAMLLQKIAFSGAEVIGHNIETPRKLYPVLRRGADYDRSLSVLRDLARNATELVIKSSIIIGLGESMEEIVDTLGDLKRNGVEITYVGQYLSPSKKHWPVKKFYTPEEFGFIEKRASKMGFGMVLAGPMVRSSFKAGESYFACIKKRAVKV
jgi:lipoic acid synthetase